MKINKCMECGGTDFLIQETIVHLAATCPDDKELTVYKEKSNSIERIFCKKCEAGYSEDNFETINFR